MDRTRQRDDHRSEFLAAAVTTSLVVGVLDIFERHGIHHHDDEHTSAAIGLVRDAALTYDGQLDVPQEVIATGTVLTVRQRRLLADMYHDARAWVTAGIETCSNCDGGICRAHARALARAERYRAIVRQLGVDNKP
jgi:hypothetical protein